MVLDWRLANGDWRLAIGIGEWGPLRSTVADGVKTLGGTLAEAIGRALKEDWKASKAAACIKLAHDKFTVGAQVSKMLSDWMEKALPAKTRGGPAPPRTPQSNGSLITRCSMVRAYQIIAMAA